jgi:translation elongation factor EF-G
MFVSMVLENIWQVYQKVTVEQDSEAIQKIINALNLKVPPRELLTKDPQLKLQAVMSRWLPIPQAILGMVIEKLPDPVTSQAYRMERIWPHPVLNFARSLSSSSSSSSSSSTSSSSSSTSSSSSSSSSQFSSSVVSMAQAALKCDHSTEHVLVYVAKMIDIGLHFFRFFFFFIWCFFSLMLLVYLC